MRHHNFGGSDREGAGGLHCRQRFECEGEESVEGRLLRRTGLLAEQQILQFFNLLSLRVKLLVGTR